MQIFDQYIIFLNARFCWCCTA